MIDEKLKEDLESMGYTDITEVPGHGVCALMPMIFTTGLFCNCTEYGYSYRYCYENRLDALYGIENFTEEHPPGPWIKRKGEGGDFINPNLGDHNGNS